MSKTASLVFTTIFDPKVLDDIYNNLNNFNHLEEVKIIVIPDKKTPPEAFERCIKLKEKGLIVSCPSIEEQEKFLSSIEFNTEYIPYNSDNRRNIGYLMALQAETDFLISIDDDNFCSEDIDFFSEHAIVCNDDIKSEIVSSDDGWFNICELLEFNPHTKVYPRGFPYYARHTEPRISTEIGNAKITINQGLWLLDPDIDGISWLVNPARVKSFKNKSLILSKKSWSPINTQNTSLHRCTIPAYYFIKMGYPLAGVPIDRYGDIFSGYFVEACAKHLDHSIRFGAPIAEHRRNSHNYMNDAANEWACIMVLEDFLPWLKEIQLQGNNYADAYISLSHHIQDAVEGFKGKIWTDATRGYFHQIAFYMRKWANVSKKFL